MATAIQNESQYIDAFLKLTLRPASASDLFPLLTSLTPQQRQDFVELADSNHVVIRAFEVLNRVAGNRGNADIQAWAVEVLAKERARIGNALNHLEKVCNALEEEGCPTVVMKTLDHWPDLGNDLDLVSTGAKAKIVNVFTKRFGGKIEARSEHGRGTIFNIRFPIDPDAMPAPESDTEFLRKVLLNDKLWEKLIKSE